MTLLIADKSNPKDSLMQQLNQSVAAQHWYTAFCEHFTRDKERYDTMRAIMHDAGVGDFDPKTISFFQSSISQRYVGNSPIFLRDEDVKKFWSQDEVKESLQFTLADTTLYFPHMKMHRGARIGCQHSVFWECLHQQIIAAPWKGRSSQMLKRFLFLQSF